MTTINALDAKPTVEAADEFEIHDPNEPDPLQRSKKVSAAAVLGSGLDVLTDMVTLGLFKIERVSSTRLQILFGSTPILTLDGSSNFLSSGVADFRIQRSTWPSKPMFVPAADSDTGLGFPVPDEAGIAAGGVEVARFRTSAGAVNRLQITPAPTGQAVEVEAVGDDVDVDLRLAGKGAGSVRVGELVPATDPAAFVATHRLELKAEDGTPVFLAVSTAAW